MRQYNVGHKIMTQYPVGLWTSIVQKGCQRYLGNVHKVSCCVFWLRGLCIPGVLNLQAGLHETYYNK